jgi:MFS family permease
MSQQAVVFDAFYLQLVRDMSARSAGVLLTTVPLAMAVAAPVSGRLSDRYGSRGLSADSANGRRTPLQGRRGEPMNSRSSARCSLSAPGWACSSPNNNFI